jgi:hypothetical protein
MKQWFNKNYRTLIILAFLVPIIIVAVVSISHVTEWYGLSNPISWAVYLSVGIEIAALSALSAISANMGSKVYFPFIIVTLIQFIGNIFFSYTYINIDSEQFKDWVSLVSPLLELMGIEEDNFIGHKRFLSFFAGGMLPLISLTFLHMLVKFTEEDRVKDQKLEEDEQRTLIDNHVIEEHVNRALENYKKELEKEKIDASDIVSEVSRIRLSDDDLKILETVLMNPKKPKESFEQQTEEVEQQTEEVEQQTEEVEQPSESTIEEKEEVIESSEESGSGDDIVDNNIVDNTLDDNIVDTLETMTVDDEELIDEVKEIENEVSEINEDTEKKNF